MNPLSRHDRRVCLLVVALLAYTSTEAATPFAFFPSLSGGYAHILPIFSLYPSGAVRSICPDTMIEKGGNPPAKVVSVLAGPDKAGNLVITMPATGSMKYRLRFFDGENHFLFEVRQITDSSLTIEKVNFEHSGIFRCEIYKENQLLERSSFIIKNE